MPKYQMGLFFWSSQIVGEISSCPIIFKDWDMIGTAWDIGGDLEKNRGVPSDPASAAFFDDAYRMAFSDG